MTLSFILLVLLGGFVLFGLWFGFVHALGALAGTVVGAFIASRLAGPVAGWVAGTLQWDPNLLRVIAFLVLFVIINRAVGLLFYVLERAFRFLTIIPFLSTIDKLLGGILAFCEGVIVLGLTLFVASKFPFGPLADMISESSVAVWLIQTASLLLPLLPKAIRSVV